MPPAWLQEENIYLMKGSFTHSRCLVLFLGYKSPMYNLGIVISDTYYAWFAFGSEEQK